MFGGMPGMGRRVKVRKEVINVSLEDIYNEKTLNINLKKQVICKICNGTGGLHKDSIIKCESCDGSGQILKIVQLGPGMISQSRSMCNKCNGPEQKIIVL